MAIRGLKSLTGLVVAAIFALPAFANTPNASVANAGVENPNTAVPGLINYIEGQVSIGTQVLNSSSVGSAKLQAGESLTTGNDGKAEVLLTPGVFLRVGHNSSVKMVFPDLVNTMVELDKGHAMVEAADVHKENNIRVMEGGQTIRLLKPGLYDFDLRQDQLRVFDGKARLEEGGKKITVKGGRELDLAQGSKPKATKFKKEQYEGDLYKWSSLRSAYLAEANVNLGDMYASDMWGGWAGPNWYWDPWFASYTYLPGDGVFYSPFGWGFYSPWLAYNAPFYPFFGSGRFFGHGVGRPFPHRFNAFSRDWAGRSPYVADGNYSHGIYRGPGSMGGGFHSGPQSAGVRGGEFGGGFRGGGFGAEPGGFRGGGGGFHR